MEEHPASGLSRRRALGLVGGMGLAASAVAAGLTGPSPAVRASVTGGSSAAGSGTAPSDTGATPSDPGADERELLDAAPTCILVRESITGPYYVEQDLVRRDIREGRPGRDLSLALRVHDVTACARGGGPAAVPDALVEIWQCDSGGVYSRFEAMSLASGARPPEEAAVLGNSLRGAQISNAGGIVRFTTIYPGWYPGRAVHIHLKVRLDTRTLLTTQLYFDDAITDEVLSERAYAGRVGRRVRNDDDNFFDPTGLLVLHRRAGGTLLGVLNLGVAAVEADG